jgi:hypothetical protein
MLADLSMDARVALRACLASLIQLVMWLVCLHQLGDPSNYRPTTGVDPLQSCVVGPGPKDYATSGRSGSAARTRKFDPKQALPLGPSEDWNAQIPVTR